MRQSRIGHQQYGDGGIPEIFPDHPSQLRGTQRTVHADGIRPHALQHGNHGGGGGAGHQLSVLAVSVGDDNGQICVFLGGKQCRLGLITVVHGLNENEIRTKLGAVSDGFGKNGDRLFKIKIPVRLQQFSRGTDVQGDVGFLLACGDRRLGVGNGGPYDLAQFTAFKLE